MNGKIKFHKPTGPAFNAGEVWKSGGIRVTILSVKKMVADGQHISDWQVYYDNGEGITTSKDAWNFQVRYTHVADLEATK